MKTAVKHEMIDLDYNGFTYWTPNGRRFFLDTPPQKEKKENQTEYTFTEVKDPKILKKLRRIIRHRYGNPTTG